MNSLKMDGSMIRPAADHAFAQPHIWRDFAGMVLRAWVSALATSGVLALLVLILASTAHAQGTLAQPGEVKTGSLLFKSTAGNYLIAPTLHTDVAMQVSGFVNRVRVTQQFRNPSDRWQEGVYVFPLPEKSAVDHLQMRIGARVIEGQIKERIAAKKAYEQAKAEGKKASLVEQERPNIFTTSVAHIGPGETVEVAIEYQETLRFEQGAYRLRFPMVVAPRYVSGNALGDGLDTGEGWACDTDAVPDASRITPPVVAPGTAAINPVALAIDLNAGFALSDLQSPYHAIEVDRLGDARFRVTLAAGTVPANRDFELVWSPKLGAAPQAALFHDVRDGEHYALAMIMPPAVDAAASRLAREAIFVIDTSGSMEGASIAQAKAALSLALDRLTPQDRFNVIEFNHRTRALFATALPVTPSSMTQAKSFVAGLRAGGGTEMLSALDAALNGSREASFVRQVVFLTDGEVGNEAQLFALIQKKIGDTRLFTVGIGSAPNTHFMTKAAEVGRGTFTYIGKVEEVGEKMQALFAKIEQPALTDIRVDWAGADKVEMWPLRVPDLYAGEPVIVTAKLPLTLAGHAQVEVTGMRGSYPWAVRLPLAGGEARDGIATLWAREKIETLTDAGRFGANPEDIRTEIIQIALKAHLVSRYTSLVAVDVTPTLPAGASSTTTALPTNLPEGWSQEAVLALPQTATSAPLHLLLGLLSMLLAVGLVMVGGATARQGGEQGGHKKKCPTFVACPFVPCPSSPLSG